MRNWKRTPVHARENRKSLMIRRQFFMALGLIAVLVICLNSASVVADMEKGRPRNVILLLVDDMGYGDIAAHGNPIIKTPNFDALHDGSARFTNFAVSPSCAPTRAALLTGKHEFLSSVTHTIKPMREMNLKSTTIAQLFQKKGYRTGIFGKWHLELAGPYNPGRRGFDEVLTCIDDNYKKSHFNPTLVKNGTQTKCQGYRTDIFFDESIRFIERNKDRPFFLYLATHSPHSPHKVAGRYSKPYEALKERYEGKKYGTGFFGMIANVDENLGRLMVRLAELGLEDNTLLIAMNDNGGTGGVDVFNDGRRGVKGTIWSGGTRAYSFWKWGDRFVPGPRPQMAGHVDVLPTLADLCGFEISEELRRQLEGDSLRPVLEDANATLDENRMQIHHVGRWADPKTWRAHKYTTASVRWKSYTLVRTDHCGSGKCSKCDGVLARGKGEARPSYTTDPAHHTLAPHADKWALYDLASDPFQRNDIAARHFEIAAKMSAHYEAWWKKVEQELTARWGE
jgi:arylsulfatase A-like enzyme